MPATKNITIITLLSTLLFASSTASVQAQSTISAIPPRLILSGKPGETINAELKVRNDSETTQYYSIAIDDFIVSDRQGTPIPVKTSTNNRWSLASWITSPSMIPVDAKATQTIKIQIKVPLTALPGSHFAMLTYTPNAELRPGDLKKTASLVSQRVGSLIYFTVAGPVTEKINITRFSIPRFTEKGPIDIEGTIESLSDIHLSPLGKVTIYGPLKTQIAEIPLEIGNLFPETSKDFATVWPQKWGWGRYRADLHLAYGTTGSLATATIFFWFFPIRLVIYLLVAIISILTIIILLNKRSNKHRQLLEEEVNELKQELEKLESTKK